MSRTKANDRGAQVVSRGAKEIEHSIDKRTTHYVYFTHRRGTPTIGPTSPAPPLLRAARADYDNIF